LFNASERFGNAAVSAFTLQALMYGDSVFDIWFVTFNWTFLIAEIFNYAFLFVVILVIQNTFVIIIGDGYVKSKYYHKNDWVKANDQKSKTTFGVPLPITESPEGEDPFKPFYDYNEKAQKSRNALLHMLKKDKEIGNLTFSF